MLVGAYPLGVAGWSTAIEIVCRAVDLPAFARMMERSYGQSEGFALHPGRSTPRTPCSPSSGWTG